MKNIKIFATLLLLITINGGIKIAHGLPDNFVFLSDVDPTIIEKVRYSTDQNFLGRPVTGYESPRIVCTKEAAEHLKKAHDFFKENGYKIVVYDGYRPQRAVDDFKKWSEDAKDEGAKTFYYPTLEKKNLFELGYIAGEHSTHSRGSTFDLTLIKIDQSLMPIVPSKRSLSNKDEILFLEDNTIDMGSSFDLFHEASHHDSPFITDSSYIKNRNLLREGMKASGFKEYHEEWWHYTLENEPYPDTYFDFVVEK